MRTLKKYGVVLILVSVAMTVGFAQSVKTENTVQAIGSRCYVYRLHANTRHEAENILVLETKAHVLVVGTTGDVSQTIQLLNWISEHLKKPIALVLVAHAHADQIGGVSIFLNNRFPIYGSSLTDREALRQGFRRPDHVFFNDTVFHCDSVHIETYTPAGGFGDDLAAYIPEYNILYAGGLVRDTLLTASEKSDTMAIRAWLHNLAALKKKYPHPKIVIPSFGETGSVSVDATERFLQNSILDHP
jgi:metallo-beta-lactamase class B